MIAGVELGPGTLFSARCQASALVVYESSASVLPANFALFFESRADLIVGSKPRLHRLGLEMRSASFCLSSDGLWSSACLPFGSNS